MLYLYVSPLQSLNLAPDTVSWDDDSSSDAASSFADENASAGTSSALPPRKPGRPPVQQEAALAAAPEVAAALASASFQERAHCALLWAALEAQNEALAGEVAALRREALRSRERETWLAQQVRLLQAEAAGARALACALEWRGSDAMAPHG